MNKPVISVENLSKVYRIGLKEEIPDTLMGAATGWLKAPWKNFNRLRRLNTFNNNGDGDDTLWALKDVSFEVNEGEVVGIIGRNGAGKSTLLKVLSRITEPTSGRAIIRGRIASLLEVGTGFHPELTGRENIYMNGTILGMRKKEIDRKFDEIVDFSGVEKFLDTPTKRYSSGMQVRLAFAVAAHLDPEILIIDEVLAVGDFEFQKKCLGKMQDVAQSGRTVLFVSHNIGAISALCSSAVLLASGELTLYDSAHDVVATYLAERTTSLANAGTVSDDASTGFTAHVPIRHHRLRCGEPLRIRAHIECPDPLDTAAFGFVLSNLDGPVVGASSRFQRIVGRGSTKVWAVECDISDLPLNQGRYNLSLWFGTEDRDLARFTDLFIIEVAPADVFDRGLPVPKIWGSLYWAPRWNISPALHGSTAIHRRYTQ